MGFDLVDLEYVKENAEWYLRVFIDRRGGIGIDDCERFSKEFSKILDREDFIAQSYILEISSPGLDRPLKTESDFLRYEGEAVDVKMAAGWSGNISYECDAAIDTSSVGEAVDGVKKGKRGKKDKGKPKMPDARKGTGEVSGILAGFEGGRVYLKDSEGAVFSLAWEDIKTVKRAIRF